MADPLLTPTEFAQQIKAKYPDYASVPDDVLATKMLEKYPEYKDRVRIPDFKTTNEPPSPSLWLDPPRLGLAMTPNARSRPISNAGRGSCRSVSRLTPKRHAGCSRRAAPKGT